MLLGIVRQATKMNMHDCWSFICCFSLTLGSLSKCGHLNVTTGSLLAVSLEPPGSLWKCGHLFYRYYTLMFSRIGATGSTSFFSKDCILIGCMIFLSQFLHITSTSMSIVYFLAQLDSGILCLFSAFL